MGNCLAEFCNDCGDCCDCFSFDLDIFKSFAKRFANRYD